MPTSKLLPLALATSIIALTTSAAFSADDFDEVAAPTNSTVVWFGGEAGEFGHVGYAGLVTALNGDLNSDDVLFRISGAFADVSYTSVGTNFDLDALSGDISLGYQTVTDDYRASIFAGVDFRDNDVSPFDPNNTTIGDETGFKVQGEFTSTGNSGGYLNLIGNYSTAYDSYYTRARLGLDVGDGIIFGAEGSLLGNQEFDGSKVGGFVSGIQLGDLFLSVNVGYQQSDGTGSNDGIYGGASAAILF